MSTTKKELKLGRNLHSQAIQHTEEYDDNLLPDAAQIEKLHQLDNTILPWLKERAEQEQKFRHSAYDKRIKLVDEHNCRDHNTARYALTIYMFLVAGCILASYLLIKDGHNMQGTIFGGAAAVLALAVLITRRQPQKPDDLKK